MNIIKSDLVDTRYDAFWEDIAPIIADATPKPVLVIVNDYEQGSQEHQQLQKRLEVCKLLPEQYNIIQVKEDQRVAWHQLRDRLDPKIIFLVGILPAQLGISAMFKLHEPNHFNDRIWLPAISIKEQEQHPEIKTQLWRDGMKPIFVDKSYVAF